MINRICPDCQGQIKQKDIIHDIRFNGQLYSFQSVPAKVCGACGAVYLDAKVLKQIESVFKRHSQPEAYQKVPLFSYAKLA